MSGVRLDMAHKTAELAPYHASEGTIRGSRDDVRGRRRLRILNLHISFL
jgi:hypothetical protein